MNTTETGKRYKSRVFSPENQSRAICRHTTGLHSSGTLDPALSVLPPPFSHPTYLLSEDPASATLAFCLRPAATLSWAGLICPLWFCVPCRPGVCLYPCSHPLPFGWPRRSLQTPVGQSLLQTIPGPAQSHIHPSS